MNICVSACFLDRDGTIIRDAHFLRDPADVELLPGASTAIRRLNNLAIPVVVVTNQSGIARGLLSSDDYTGVAERVEALLASGGARIDATYYCPHHPDFSGPCDCRKPGTRLFERAAAEHDLQLERAAFIGDRWRDVVPARAFGATGVLIHSDSTPTEDLARAEAANIPVVSSLAAAVETVVGGASNPIKRE